MRHPAIEVTHDMLEMKTIINVTADARWTTGAELHKAVDAAIQRMLFYPAPNWWEETVADVR